MAHFSVFSVAAHFYIIKWLIFFNKVANFLLKWPNLHKNLFTIVQYFSNSFAALTHIICPTLFKLSTAILWLNSLLSKLSNVIVPHLCTSLRYLFWEPHLYIVIIPQVYQCISVLFPVIQSNNLFVLESSTKQYLVQCIHNLFTIYS